ncbi:MAG: ParB N-terminal domain-containing protein, partial [Candidatus Aenigmarchaeota archaeon]|nr:ParB N-terminal domain-containing protein [Candidatus Aenigmarchaeota archaeon]
MAGKQQAKKSENTTIAAGDNKLYWPIEKLHEWQDNPRSVKPEDFDRLKKQIAELGEYKPLIITPDGEVIGGNMRFKAYTELGKKKVWVSIVNPKDEKEKLKYALSDNDSVGFYVKDYMVSLITPFKEDVSFLGEFKVNFDVGKDLNELLKDLETKEEKETEPDDAEPVSKLGEVYQLGRHRIMCGDSTDWETVSTLMDGKRADISFTSPPYNAGKTPTEEKMGVSGKYENNDDDRSDEDYLSLLNTSTLVSLEFSDYSFVNLQSISGNKIPLIDFLYQMKEKYCDTIIWDKINSQPAMASNVLNSEFEYVHVFSDKATRAIGTKEFRGTLKNII